jgi:hypothetical protein
MIDYVVRSFTDIVILEDDYTTDTEMDRLDTITSSAVSQGVCVYRVDYRIKPRNPDLLDPLYMQRLARLKHHSAYFSKTQVPFWM